MSKPIRVAMVMGKMIGGGVESVIMNYYRNINRDMIQFDFIIDEDSTIIPEEEIVSLGGRIYKIPPYQHIFSYMKELGCILRMNDYKIIHSNINTLSIFPLMVAKKCNIPIRIVHNHSTAAPGETSKNFVKFFLKKFSRAFPTHYFAPTKYAGEWLFGSEIANQNLYIIKNAIDIGKFCYKEKERIIKRAELQYNENDFVVGNIGRMVWQKNQKFVMEVFLEIKKSQKNAKLLIVGDGPLREELEEYARSLTILDDIKIISNSDNIQNYYQVMDVLLFPSNYEGLGMVAIEAQATGLPVFCSNRVPKDVDISSLCNFEDLDSSAKKWASTIIEYFKLHGKYNRVSMEYEIDNSGYNIYNNAMHLVELYISFIKKNNIS